VNKKLLFLSIVLGVSLITSKAHFTIALEEEVTEEEIRAAEKVTEETITKSLKDKLEEVATDKIERVKSALSGKSGLYAYVGLVSNVEENLITITTNKGEKRAEINDQSTIVFFEKGQAEKKIKPEEIEEDSYAIAMGEMKDNEIISIQRIMLSTKPTPPPEKKVVFGKIEEIDSKKVKIKNSEELELNLPKNLNLEISSVGKPEIADVEIEDKTILVLKKTEDEDSYSLIAMFVIPGKNNPESEKNKLEATESANVASPSAEEK